MSLFTESGIHILADGQFGSCGKGALASWLARQAIKQEMGFHAVVTNAGPNSGHTFYHNGVKHVCKQLPSFGVQSHLLGYSCPIYFTGGAVIDPYLLGQEMARYPGITVFIHPGAALVDEETKQAEEANETIRASASTLSGTGMALVNRINREPHATWGTSEWATSLPSYSDTELDPARNRIFMEVSQGFSLGLYSRFYPKVTSRECTFAQGMADARFAPRYFRRGYLAFRTFPIRVGNTSDGDSGGWYPDQQETTWQALNVPEEYTTVTKRVRRVATWSWLQFSEAMHANRPTHVFLNFLNYLQPRERMEFIESHLAMRRERYERYDFILGAGPTPEDIAQHYDPIRM